MPDRLPSLTDRDALRAHFRAARRQVTGDARGAAEAAIHGYLVDYLELSAATKTIAAYASFDGEVDLTNWLHEAMSRYHAQVALPKLGEAKGEMTFRIWPRDQLERNRLGIDEPESLAQVVLAQDLDAVVVPLVAFDAKGTRLGMGGGYYDRYFQDDTRPPLVGVAFQCQQAPSLPSEPWDVTLDAVIHEGGVMELTR